MMAQMRGMGRVFQRGPVWWVAYNHRGREHRESSHSSKRSVAERLLKQKLGDIHAGTFVGPAQERVLVGELLDGLVIDYTNSARRSLDTLTCHLKPVRAAFGFDRAVDVTEARLERYKHDRLAAGKAPATINRELAAIRRAFRLGVKQKRIAQAPGVEMLTEAAPREGFVEPNQFERLVSHLPAYLQDAARFDYLVGWRKSALRGLRWPDVDRDNGRLYLRRAGSKNKKPYVIVLIGELAALIERRWQARSVARPDGTTYLSEFVFHRDGRPVGDFRRVWTRACEQAGVPGLMFHDFRRSAARNLRRAGVGPDVAMQITGHETDSMWRRYSIVKEDDIEAALQATQAYVSQQAAKVAAPVVARLEIGR
jgi:integrase